jgi:Asp/Glu/hydantoin racemase
MMREYINIIMTGPVLGSRSVLNVGGKCLNITSLNARHRSLKIIEEMIHNFAVNHMALCTLRSTSSPLLSTRSSNRTRQKFLTSAVQVSVVECKQTN